MRRADVIRDFMRVYLKQTPLSGETKHGVVCHSQIIATLTADELDPSDERGFKNYTWLKNCQILPYDDLRVQASS